jgi:hypothetical protein
MRAHRTWWTGRWSNGLGYFRQSKHLDLLPTEIAPSTCGEALDLLHLSSRWLGEDEDWAAQMKHWARDGARDFSDAHDYLSPLVPGIVRAVHSTDNPDGEAT